jgi:uncharacterized protein YndB with AHSA1/START domain
MTVKKVEKDLDALTLDLTAEFDATPERVWQLWADPRQLERWWGPPTYPAKFTEHGLTPGDHVAYVMTGPNGEKAPGWWQILEVDPPRSLSFRDGFANEDGTANDAFPETTVHVAIADVGGGKTRMSILTRFPTPAAMEQLVAMGMIEGLTEAVGQIDAILAEPVASRA